MVEPGEAMRLFVALIPPRSALDELAAAVEPLRAELPSARWTRHEAWHLTLAFLGAVEPHRVDPLTDRLDRVARQHRPIQLAFSGAGRFGQRVLWIGVAADRESLRRLAESIRAAARRTGVEIETRAYRGHITLASGSEGGDLRPLVQRLRGFAGAPWIATDLYLVRSRLGAGPGQTAVHETYARWQLSGH